MLKKLGYLMRPLLVGVAMGIVAGGAIVLLGRVLSFDYTPTQEIWAFTGFTMLGALFGIVDSIGRLLAWSRFRRGPGNHLTNMGSD
ncbi:MAG: hypothetical protein AB1584_07585 [Pseudomonadota bacterium]